MHALVSFLLRALYLIAWHPPTNVLYPMHLRDFLCVDFSLWPSWACLVKAHFCFLKSPCSYFYYGWANSSPLHYHALCQPGPLRRKFLERHYQILWQKVLPYHSLNHIIQILNSKAEMCCRRGAEMCFYSLTSPFFLHLQEINFNLLEGP